MKKLAILLLVPVLTILTACPTGTTKQLATASDAIAHGLANAQAAAREGVNEGVISQSDETVFESYLSSVAQAGLVLDQGIRANENATTVSTKVNSFLDAFNALNTTGIAGIKNPNLKLTISTIITGAETSVAVIAATVGK